MARQPGENFGGDRGLRLSKIAGIEATVEQHPRESDTNTYASRRAIDTASAVGGPDICAAMQRAADRLMALASDELHRRGDRVGEHALRPSMRTPWTRTSTLIYPAGATLSRHSDGCGNWVVLFSFGRTATFFCGDASEDLESGDAILFNEGPGGLRRARRLSLPRGGSTRLSTASRGVAVYLVAGPSLTRLLAARGKA